MNKTIFTLALSAALLAGLLLTPYGVQGVLDIKSANEQAVESRDAMSSNLQLAQNQAVADVQAFIDNRTFGVAYDDVTKLASVLGSVSGIEILNVYDVDPSQGYVDIGYNTENSKPKAVRFELSVVDPYVALNAIETLQLAVVSIEYNTPDVMDVIFLVGGVI